MAQSDFRHLKESTRSNSSNPKNARKVENISGVGREIERSWPYQGKLVVYSPGVVSATFGRLQLVCSGIIERLLISLTSPLKS
jgi:hypothetical protein